MEHLFFQADQESVEDRVTAAFLSDILEDDWTNIRHDFRKMPHVHPITPWLGFGHDPVSGQPENRPPVQRAINDYSKIRGWNIERAWARNDLRLAHLSFVNEQTSSSLVAHQLAVML